MATTQAGLRRRFEGAAKARILVECGGSTPWVVRLLESFGHEVVVVNPRRVRLIAESTLKCDRIDAEILARLSRIDPELLRPVYQRSYECQLLRTRLRLRSSLVQARAALINQIRGTLRAHGAPMSSCAAKVFVVRFATGPTPQDLKELLELPREAGAHRFLHQGVTNASWRTQPFSGLREQFREVEPKAGPPRAARARPTG